MTDRFALVALPLPLATPYTYRIPETQGDRVVPGAASSYPSVNESSSGWWSPWTPSPPRRRPEDVACGP